MRSLQLLRRAPKSQIWQLEEELRRFEPAGRARRSIRRLLTNDAAKAEAIKLRIQELDEERAKLVLNVAQQARAVGRWLPPSRTSGVASRKHTLPCDSLE